MGFWADLAESGLSEAEFPLFPSVPWNSEKDLKKLPFAAAKLTDPGSSKVLSQWVVTTRANLLVLDLRLCLDF